jgi:hypothetical protein
VRLTILWRGPLESCNYGCEYCPFAKKVEGPAELARDRAALARFVEWVEARPAVRPGQRLALFFTPWGEALVRPWYREALARLSRLPHVDKVAVQTNLSVRLDWVEQADPAKLGLWATYHPGEVDRARFVARCLDAVARGVPLSAGIVGLREHLDEAEALRRELPPHVYVWVNAYKRVADYYAPGELARLEAVDPLFRLNTVHHPSRGRACRAGAQVLSVDGEGVVRRCHFVRAPIGSIYDPDFEACLAERPCPNETCGCHIGYVHLDHLGLAQVFGSGLLERIPVRRVWAAAGAGG